MRYHFLIAVMTFAATSGAAHAQTGPDTRNLQRASIYQQFGNAVFIRGGYIFTDTDDAPIDTQAIYGAIGASGKIARRGRSKFSAEGEIIVFRDGEDELLDPVSGLPIAIAPVSWSVSAVGGVRWQYELTKALQPYASVGLGVSHLRASTPLTQAASTWTFAYTGRAGLEARLTDSIGLEGGYRYLGLANGGSVGFHALEVGLNYRF